MVYLEAFRHSTIVVRVELLVGQGALSPDAVALEDPEATTGTLPPGPARVALPLLVAYRRESTFFCAELCCGAVAGTIFGNAADPRRF